jgi:hypothetical protein
MTSRTATKNVKRYLQRAWTKTRKNPGTVALGVIAFLSGELLKKILDKVYDAVLAKLGKMAEPHVPDWLVRLLSLGQKSVMEPRLLKDLLHGLTNIGWWIGVAVAALVSLVGIIILVNVFLTSSEETESSTP